MRKSPKSLCTLNKRFGELVKTEKGPQLRAFSFAVGDGNLVLASVFVVIPIVVISFVMLTPVMFTFVMLTLVMLTLRTMITVVPFMTSVPIAVRMTSIIASKFRSGPNPTPIFVIPNPIRIVRVRTYLRRTRCNCNGLSLRCWSETDQ